MSDRNGHDQARADREQELQQLLLTRAGRLRVWKLFLRYWGTEAGKMPPGASTLIRAILAHEFPESAPPGGLPTNQTPT